MDVAAWLHDRGFDRYAKTFEDNDIDAEVLVTLTEADLKELGVWSLGHRRKLMAAISDLQKGLAPPTGHPAPAAARPPVRREFGVVAVALPVDVSPDLRRLTAESAEAILVDHGGVVDRLADSGLLATFGTGADTDGQIDCAVQAALEIRDELKRSTGGPAAGLSVTIGIDGGSVVGLEVAAPFDSMAALARTLAAEGSDSDILASKTVVDATAGRMDWRAVDNLGSQVHGGTVRAWRLNMPGAAVAMPKDLPIAGRQPVLKHFDRMIDNCLANGRAQGVMILGPAGSGKTRLVEELSVMARERGLRRIVLRNGGFGEVQAGDAVATLAASLMDTEPDASPDELRSAIDRFMDARVVEPKWRAALNELFFLPQEPEIAQFWRLLDAAGREQGIQSVLRELMRGSLSGHPSLLIIEDIQNAGSRTLVQLAGLVRDLDDLPVVFAATARKETAPLRPEWIAALQHNNARTIQLDPLTADEAAVLAEGYPGVSRPEASRCIERARGNPWFLQQLLLARQAGRASDGLTTVESLVLARRDRLPPVHRRALDAAAVLGHRGSMRVVRMMIGEDRYDAAVLVSERFLETEGDRYHFAISAECDVIYGALGRPERQDLHASAARCFAGKEHALYARHLERAADSNAPRAYAQAAETSMAELRHGRARALIRQGLQTASSEDDRSHLTGLEGDCLLAIGSHSQAVTAYRKALEHAQHDAQRCRCLIGIGRGLAHLNRFSEALAELDDAQALAEGRSLVRELARIHGLKGRLCFPLGRIHQADEHFGLALDFARRASVPEEAARACRGLGRVAEEGGRMAIASSHYADAADTARAHGLGELAIEDDLALARTRYYLEPLGDVIEQVLSIVNRAAMMGHGHVEHGAHVLASALLYDLGRFEAVLEHFDRALEVESGDGAGRAEAAIASFAARALSALDRHDEARILLGEALKVARENEPAVQGGFVLGAVVLLARGRKTRESAFAEGAGLLARGVSSHSELRFYRDAIDAALDAGDPKQAMHYVALLDAFNRIESQPWSDFVIARGRALATVRAGRGDAATGRELRHLMADAKRLGYAWAQPAMREALDDLRRSPVEFQRHPGRRLDVPIDVVPDAKPQKGPERRRS